jgi:hypothetical protein
MQSLLYYRVPIIRMSMIMRQLTAQQQLVQGVVYLVLAALYRMHCLK